MEIWLGASSVLLVVGTSVVLVGLRKRREAHKLRELRRTALAKLAVTAEHVALAPLPTRLLESPDEALTNVYMVSLKKQMEIQARSRLARGSQPPPAREAPVARALDSLFDDFDLEDQSEPAPLL